MISPVSKVFYHQTMMTRNQTKIAAATATINPSSNDSLVIDNNPVVVYPTMFDRWNLPL
jgi:hypothetical protein